MPPSALEKVSPSSNDPDKFSGSTKDTRVSHNEQQTSSSSNGPTTFSGNMNRETIGDSGLHHLVRDQQATTQLSSGMVDVQTTPQSNVKIELPTDEHDDSSAGNDGDGSISNGNGSPMDDESSKLEDSSELSFTKKLVKKSRTQSFQSVLSTASLKSLKYQSAALGPGSTSQTTSRNNSMIGDTTSKNFQSFIQAPVLSSITKFRRSDDDIPIGQQLPFNDKLKNESTTVDGNLNKSANTSNSDTLQVQNQANQTSSTQVEDDELLLQQQRLTLNALRNLRLSPLPLAASHNKTEDSPEDPKSTSRVLSRSKVVLEPYQPAEVDLSTFASLTRQPKLSSRNSFTSSLPKLPEKPSQTQEQPNENTTTTTRSLHSLPNSPQLVNQPGLHPQQQSHHGVTNQSATQQGIPQAILQKLNNDFRPAQFPQQLHQQGSISKDLTMKRQPSMSFSKAYHQQQQQHHYQQQQQLQQHQQHQQQVPSPGQSTLTSFKSQTNQASQHQQLLQQQQQQQQQQQPQQQLHQNPQGGHDTPEQQLLPHRQIQQIKGLRSPMYIPAVLRKTQNTPINSTGTSPKEGETGFFSQDLDTATGQVISSTNSVRSFDSNNNGEYSITKKPSFIDSALDSITKLAPTRKHWLKDEHALKCGIPSCPKIFNFFERRHHCRKCGGIFCNEHTSHYLYINNQAQFTIGGRGTLSKVCDNCISEYNVFIKNQFGMKENQSNPSSPSPVQALVSEGSTAGTATATAAAAAANQARTASKAATTTTDLTTEQPTSESAYDKVNELPQFRRKDSIYDNRNEQLVGSVPANWSWSSF
ncbi:uncharacterized protein KQ657_004320 [Scheffersomyces spartinae]|uniref:FYVE-type domain-containing protein n=1 Tax=Scheffersomyces spartinae TaxID=45513 RepID=A0A9P7VAZ8_9ASCO|nr:uncharacterized protein KQ657_004320 [Scheffersomyces spartinae]KAG7194644.1 hypothetical protein KQ657_004320 [Scheffersomyces spartinae]